MTKLVNIGFGNIINADKIVTMIAGRLNSMTETEARHEA